MKTLLAILSSVGLVSSAGVPIALSYVKTETIKEQKAIQGTVITNLIAQKRVKDKAAGKSKQDKDEKTKKILWAELGITPNLYNKIDFDNSTIVLAIKHGYGDNSAGGHANGWDTTEEFKIARFWSSGEREYNEDRHHGGKGRNTDHQWKYSLKVEADGLIIWDWVWVWANGNWGNVANSVADINIKSLYYNFKLI